MKNKTILQIHESLLKNEITVSELTNYYINKTKELISKDSNAILLDLSNNAIETAKKLDEFKKNNNIENNLLFGINCCVKDNICIKNFKTTGGSKVLENYIPSYDAFVVEKLKQNHCIINSKNNMDELGLGGTGLYSAFGHVNNIINPGYITAGSSSGTALAIKYGASHFGIATDTGDSIRRPCSFLGLIGYKPSYGLISRYGVLPYSSSLDHVGVICNHLIDLCVILDAIVQKDERDTTNIKKDFNFLKNFKEPEKIKIGIFNNIDKFWTNQETKQSFNDFIISLKKQKNVQIIEFNLDEQLINLIEPLYQVISYSEAVSNWNNINGILFGENKNIDYKNYQDLMFKIRTKYLSTELKKRFVFGNIATNSVNFEPIFLKAKKIINIFKNLFNDYFKNVDCFLIPSASSTTVKVQDVLENKFQTNQIDDLMQIANFAGLPSLTLPLCTINGFSFGINIFGQKYNDSNLINMGLLIQNIIKEK